MFEAEPTAIEPLRSGRYLGGDGQWWVELRATSAITIDLTPADLGIAGLVEARAGKQSTTTTDPDGSSHGRWPLTASAPNRPTITGTLTITAGPDQDGEAPGTVSMTLAWDTPEDGTPPVSGPIDAALTWTGRCVRDLGVEIEVQEGLAAADHLPTATLGEDTYTWTSVLAGAGIRARQVGEQTVLRHQDVRASLGIVDPAQESVWSTVETLRGLHDLMRRSAQTDLSHPAWRSHLLMLSRSGRKGLLGLMFDVEGLLPRQGCVVFADEVRDVAAGPRADVELLRTIAHELGHTLNLPHRFQLGNADSTSVMNYPWCYQGGNHVDDYYAACRFTFDHDELDFLQHAPLLSVIPGGSLSEQMQLNWRRAAVPSNPDDPTLQLRLWFSAPGGGTDILPGEPVFLGVNISNTGQRPVVVPRHALDVKSGRLQLQITQPGHQDTMHRPVLHRCHAEVDDDLIRLGPGQSLHDNVNLTMGSGGPIFTEPGEYVVTPLLSIPDRVASRGSDAAQPDAQEDVQSQFHTVLGEPVTITVRAPADAGLTAAYLAAISSPVPGIGLMIAAPNWLAEAEQPLNEAVETSRRRAQTEGGSDRFHAALARARALDALRSNPADEPGAAHEAVQASRRAGADAFDPHTHQQTELHFASRTAGLDLARRVVVDFGHHATTTRAIGYLDVPPNRDVAPDVLVPLKGVAAEGFTNDLQGVAVTSTAPDGLLQRLPATQVTVIRHDAEPVAAAVKLPRHLKNTDLGASATDPDLTTDAIWTALRNQHPTPDDPAQALLAVAAVADSDGTLPKDPPTVEEVDLQNVAGLAWFCRISRLCDDHDIATFTTDGSTSPPTAEPVSAV